MNPLTGTPAYPTPTHPSALSRCDPRVRVVLLLLFAFSFAAVSQPAILPLLAVIALGTHLLSGQPWGTLLRRLRAAALLIGLLIVFLPFVSGSSVLGQFGPLTLYREGSESALLIGLRFLSIFTVAHALLGSGALFDHLRALRALGLPALMTDLALLVVRYIEVTHHDLRQMRLAMRVRGGHARRTRPWLSHLREHAWLIAALLLRSHERSERVYSAMRARGYGAAAGMASPLPPLTSADTLFIALGIVLATLIVVLDWILA